MAFLELTRPTGKKIFVNTKNMIYLEIGENEDKIFTHIATSYGSIWVRETLEQILAKIKEAK